MLLTIHNLPSSTRYADVKTLLQEKCGVTEVIVDNLVNEGKSKKVTVGLASDDDGAFVVRKLNGLFINGQQLYIEDRRRPSADQPYRPAGFEPDQSSNIPAMAPAWNQAATPYMQPNVDQTVVKMEKDRKKEIEYSSTRSPVFKVEPGCSINVRIKTEPLETDYDRNTNDCSDAKTNTIKIELPDETNPAACPEQDVKPEMLKKKGKKKKPKQDKHKEPKNTSNTQNLNIIKYHIPFKEEKNSNTQKDKIKKDHIPLKEEIKTQVVPTPIKVTPLQADRLKEKDNQFRHSVAAHIARNLIHSMDPNLNKCGKQHRLRCPGHGFEKMLFKRIKKVVYERVCNILNQTFNPHLKDFNYIVQQYILRFGASDPLLYNQIHEQAVKAHKPPTPLKPRIDTSQLATLMSPDWQLRYLSSKVESDIKEQQDKHEENSQAKRPRIEPNTDAQFIRVFQTNTPVTQNTQQTIPKQTHNPNKQEKKKFKKVINMFFKDSLKREKALELDIIIRNKTATNVTKEIMGFNLGQDGVNKKGNPIIRYGCAKRGLDTYIYKLIKEVVAQRINTMVEGKLFDYATIFQMYSDRHGLSDSKLLEEMRVKGQKEYEPPVLNYKRPPPDESGWRQTEV